jgi:hypothetical protein
VTRAITLHPTEEDTPTVVLRVPYGGFGAPRQPTAPERPAGAS